MRHADVMLDVLLQLCASTTSERCAARCGKSEIPRSWESVLELMGR